MQGIWGGETSFPLAEKIKEGMAVFTPKSEGVFCRKKLKQTGGKLGRRKVKETADNTKKEKKKKKQRHSGGDQTEEGRERLCFPKGGGEGTLTQLKSQSQCLEQSGT